MKLSRIAAAATGFLRTSKGQDVGRTAIDKVSGFADKATGSKHADKIQKAREAADKQLRNLGPDGGRGQGPTPPANPPRR
ncbi:antitoxin [Clavibacter michiganensis]|uniref:Antitoxin n=1 Tax=Clavibacter michiganensis TaxID=28447 RepID=A0A2S5VRR3_9MICO|nr:MULTISPECIES: antitoxin [Clavibacter]PPF66207.1 antitoxin [Clavibacter michiganensis]